MEMRSFPPPVVRLAGATNFLLIILVAATIPTGARATTDRELDSVVLALRLETDESVIRVSTDLADRIRVDLEKITAFEPFLENVHVFLDWIPGEVIAELTPDAYAAYLEGTYAGLDPIFAEYPLAESYTLYRTGLVGYRFEEWLHSPNLVALFDAADGVESSHPNGFMGDGPDITCDAVGTYRFRYAWGDCAMGCTFAHIWVIRIDGDDIEVLEEYGWDLPLASDTMTLDALKALYR